MEFKTAYLQILIEVLVSFVIGSIPTGLIIGKLFFKKDIRTLGSKNIGATNVFRNFGKTAGITVLFLDALKGFIAVTFAARIFKLFASTPDWMFDAAHPEDFWAVISVLCGIAAITGHNWSVFLKFKGGKGVATSLGVFLALAPLEVELGALIFGLLLLLFRYVSVSSMVSAAGVAVLVFVFDRQLPVKVFSILAAAMILVRHKDNIKRLIAGTENKIWQKK